MKNTKLSIIIPCYNEEKTIIKILTKINKIKLDGIKKEIIVIDDCSNDSSLVLLQNNKRLYSKLITNEKNIGKGASLKKGIDCAKGDIIMIQDADLEYDPKEYKKMLDMLYSNDCDVVYGSRFYNKKYDKGNIINRIANKFFTYLFNKMYRNNLTDILTCYKLFRREIFDEIELIENRFCFDTEISIKLTKNNKRIFEVPISYYPRSKKEGKKIGLKDGVAITFLLIKNRY